MTNLEFFHACSESGHFVCSKFWYTGARDDGSALLHVIDVSCVSRSSPRSSACDEVDNALTLAGVAFDRGSTLTAAEADELTVAKKTNGVINFTVRENTFTESEMRTMVESRSSLTRRPILLQICVVNRRRNMRSRRGPRRRVEVQNELAKRDVSESWEIFVAARGRPLASIGLFPFSPFESRIAKMIERETRDTGWG